MLEKGFSEMLDFALGQMQCTKEDKILDFGCGNGRFALIRWCEKAVLICL